MNKAEINKQVVLKSIIISSILLAILLTLLHIFVSKLIDSDKILTGLKLLVFWVVITATLRSEVKVRKNIGGLWLLLTGLVVAGLGVILHLLTMQIIPTLKTDVGLDLAIDFKTVGFYAVIGFVASVISLINIKVESEFWGNVLEVVFVAVLAGLFFLMM